MTNATDLRRPPIPTTTAVAPADRSKERDDVDAITAGV